MYDELVKRMRTATTLPVMNALCQEAADAIEELQQIAGHYEETAKDYFKDVCYYLERVPKWIPVMERLPEETVTVIVTDGKNVGFSFCVNDYGELGFYSPWDVTHWMPLPEPPKEGK